MNSGAGGIKGAPAAGRQAAALRERVNALVRRVPTAPLYVLGLVPAAWLWWLGLTGELGPEPIRALERELGLIGLQFLLASLCVTPLRRFLGVNLMRFRRAFGLLAFAYVAQHLGVWLLLDVGDPERILAEIVKRPWVSLGMLGFAALLPLALTSTDRAIRAMGAARWRALHRLAYFSAAAGAVHYLLVVKSWPLEPVLWALATAALLALRLIPAPPAARPRPAGRSGGPGAREAGRSGG
jgi:sulfoxide reductase heme-binding subunit YedZ